MKTSELTKFYELSELLDNKGFSDRVDVSADTSLMEYGIMRNPETGLTIYALGLDCETEKPCLDWTFVEIDDVREVLTELESGFFSYIGSDRETELKNLNNEYLTGIVDSINSYNGWFRDSLNFMHNIDDITKVIAKN